jgi:drug/metabolite transporter (DMT)-like permease
MALVSCRNRTEAVDVEVDSGQISAIQVIAVRSWIILPLILVTLAPRGEIGLLATRKPLQHLLRGCFGFCAPLAFLASLKSLPLADATVVFFSSTFMLTAASALFLKERVGIYRWSAAAIGFGSVVIAMNPRAGGDLEGFLMVLAATVIYAMIFVSGKQLSRGDSVIALVFSLHFGMGLTATLMLPWFWVSMSGLEFLQLGLLAVFAMGAHYLFASAYARADVSVLAPFEYTALLWATLIGYFVWRDNPSPGVWIGAAIIIACGLCAIHRESLRHRSLSSGRDISNL